MKCSMDFLDLDCINNKKGKSKSNSDLTSIFPLKFVVVSSTQNINRLEKLPNEVFHEICEYLDGYDMFKAFSNLNNRFQSFLYHSSILLRFLYNNNKTIPLRDYYEYFILPNKHRLLSLNIIEDVYDKTRFDCSLSSMHVLNDSNL